MRYRVLIAEDEEMERRALRLILGAGALPELEILEAANGQEAVEMVGEGRLDVAFLDIRMPGLDGIETAGLLHERLPSLPIIFITAHDSFEYARSALRLHVEDFLLKPASAVEVHAALRRALGRGGRLENNATAVESPETMVRFERALAFASDELRASLAAASTPADRIGRYLGLRGSDWKLEGFIALRAETDGPPKTEECQNRFSSGPAGMKALARLAEKILASDSRLLLAGAGPRFVLCLVASRLPQEDRETLYRDFFSSLAERARTELCLRFFAGAALTTTVDCEGESAAPSELAQAAQRAATLAGAARPFILLSLSFSSKAGIDAEGAERARGTQMVQQALEILETRHAEDLSLDSVAEELGVSASHLSRLLGRHAGMGFAECLANFRVERSKVYLSSAKLSIKEASLLVGFRDPAYFARVFRKLTGESPVEYRGLRRSQHAGPPSSEETKELCE